MEEAIKEANGDLTRNGFKMVSDRFGYWHDHDGRFAVRYDAACFCRPSCPRYNQGGTMGIFIINYAWPYPVSA